MSRRRIFSLAIGIFVVVIIMWLASACSPRPKYQASTFVPKTQGQDKKAKTKVEVHIVFLIFTAIIIHVAEE